MMWDSVVLGLGGVGSFALRALSKESKNVLGIERFALGHAKGSSHGQSRIYRKAYFENPKYVPWIEYSLKEFRQLEKETGGGDDGNQAMMKECGMLLVQQAHGQYLEACSNCAREHNVVTETMGVGELRERFPQLAYQDDMGGVLEPQAGLLRPERIMRAALGQAQDHGATIWENSIVKSLKEIQGDGAGSSSYVELIVQRPGGEEEQVLARSALVAAGAWASELIPSYASHLQVIRQIQTFIDVSSLHEQQEQQMYDASNMPAFVLVTPEWPMPLYGIPVDRECDDPMYKNCIKVGVHGVEDVVNPNQNPSTVSPSEIQEMMKAIKNGINPDVCGLPFTYTSPCLYTMTKDTDFMIGAPKGYQKVCVVAGLSGHGFKMIPALGQMLADFALEKSLDPWKPDFCSPSRFGV
jgi:sarcosine oxidase